jgi:hypothetical protein
VTVAVAAEPGFTEKSSPLPVRVTVCGLPAALSVIVRVPVRVPLTVGSKKTPMAQLAPAAKVLPQAFNGAKSLELVATFVIVSAAVPVFVSVTDCGSPLVPTN